MERNSFASTFKSNKSYIYYYFTFNLGTFVIFSCFTQKLKENVGGLLGGRGKGYVGPPSQIIWGGGGGGGGWPPPGTPLPTPMQGPHIGTFSKP